MQECCRRHGKRRLKTNTGCIWEAPICIIGPMAIEFRRCSICCSDRPQLSTNYRCAREAFGGKARRLGDRDLWTGPSPFLSVLRSMLRLLICRVFDTAGPLAFPETAKQITHKVNAGSRIATSCERAIICSYGNSCRLDRR